jgi:HEAT repeat protein
MNNDYYDEDQEDEQEEQDEGEVRPTERPTLEATREALATNTEGRLNATIFYGLSGLTNSEFGQVRSAWDNLDPEYRLKLAQQMADISEVNFDLDYHAVGEYALNDSTPEVRAAAIEMLWDDESIATMNRLIEMAQWDESILVRAAAASALGNYILQGELGEIDEKETLRAQEAVVSLLSDEDEDVDVRRRALEAISNCGNDIVDGAIEDAYYGADERMKASAIYAMGRTYDERWEDIILREVDSSNPAFRFEAARASGELGLHDAVPSLARLAHEDDHEIRDMAVWSLGEIGGSQALRVLAALAEEAQDSDDEVLMELIEDAISAASLPGGDMDFDFDDE